MTRRHPGETVIIRGPAFGLPETDPVVGRIMGDESEREPWCTLGCGDPECGEWANVLLCSGPGAGTYAYHVSECQMSTPEDSRCVASEACNQAPAGAER